MGEQKIVPTLSYGPAPGRQWPWPVRGSEQILLHCPSLNESPGEGMSCGNPLVWVPRAKCLLLLPTALPLGFNQMKRILPASECHNSRRDNRLSALGRQTERHAVEAYQIRLVTVCEVWNSVWPSTHNT